MTTDAQKQTHGNIARIAGEAVSMRGYATAIDVLLGLGWLSQADLQRWRRGEIPFLEQAVRANLSKISKAMKAFRQWATHSNLCPSYTAYVRHGSGPRAPLRFSKSRDAAIERAYATHFVLKNGQRKLMESTDLPPPPMPTSDQKELKAPEGALLY